MDFKKIYFLVYGLLRLIYFIFENKTAYPLENFVIKKDEENDVDSIQEVESALKKTIENSI